LGRTIKYLSESHYQKVFSAQVIYAINDIYVNLGRNYVTHSAAKSPIFADSFTRTATGLIKFSHSFFMLNKTLQISCLHSFTYKYWHMWAKLPDGLFAKETVVIKTQI
jgi:hypothetical protein